MTSKNLIFGLKNIQRRTPSCICIISTKNPNHILINTIQNVKLYYPEFKIVIIDSDSTNLYYFKLVPSDVKIEYCKNKNWELGAWCYAFEKYNNYDVYMFIQDSLTPIQRIPNLNVYNINEIYSFHYNAKICDGGYFDDLKEIYKDTELSFISNLDPSTPIVGTAHTSFLTNKDNVSIILKLENVYKKKNITKTKIHSWLSERCGGLMIERTNIVRYDITRYFKKQSLNRT
jgi:hypothetical protein